MLDFERLDVYQRALEFVALAYQIIDNLPVGSGSVVDQLKRAAMSIPLNIAEASGRVHSADRVRFHSIARGSAMECAAILDVIKVIDRVDEQKHCRGKQIISRIVAMLSKMCR